MGLQVVLEDEDRNELATLEDPSNILHRILPSPDDGAFRFVNQIDWYGDTTFNNHQVTGVRRELAQIVPKSISVDEQSFVKRLDDLLARCENEPHLYVKFYGD